MSSILDRIINKKKQVIEASKKQTPVSVLKESCASMEPTRGFAAAVAAARGPAIIAELKKASPSKGLLCPDFSVERLARLYADNGATAASVLTEKDFFMGDLSYVARAKSVSPLPALRKDFIIDAYQVYETRACGADAMLLIVAALGEDKLSELLGLARELTLDALVEVHDAAELKIASNLPCDLIGVNNRNLKTGEVNIRTSLELADGIRGAACKISESGIKNSSDVSLLYEAGYKGFLIGETLVTSDDPGRALRELTKGTEII